MTNSMSDFSVMLFPWDKKKPKVSDIVEITQLAEDLGFYSATLPTHMTMPPGWLFTDFENTEILDALVVVPAMAQATSKIKIGFNSVLFPILPPYHWAKYLSTLDVMSGGRCIAGTAMGWWEEDFTSVGVDIKKRGKMFTEQLEVITRLWTEERVTFEGEHYQLKDMTLEPKPIQQPGPPIWIGGGVKSIWRTAKYGECILCFWPSEEAIRDTWIPELRKQGAKYSTDPKLASFTFVYVANSDADYLNYHAHLQTAVGFENPSVTPEAVTISGSPEQCASNIKRLQDAGVWHFVLEFQFHGLESVSFGMKQMEKFAMEVVPLLK